MLRGGVLLIGGGVSLLIRGAVFSLHLSFHRSISTVGSVDACGLRPFKSPPAPTTSTTSAPTRSSSAAVAAPHWRHRHAGAGPAQRWAVGKPNPPPRFVPLQSGFDALMFLSEGE